MRYIESNPVRTNMVRSPAHYPWSSYRCNAQGKVNELITPHSLYLSLGRTRAQRQEAYKGLFKPYIADEDLNNIRGALQTGTPLGSDLFKAQVEEKIGMKVGQARLGRPVKEQSLD